MDIASRLANVYRGKNEPLVILAIYTDRHISDLLRKNRCLSIASIEISRQRIAVLLFPVTSAIEFFVIILT
jgi:hypothetical protein